MGQKRKYINGLLLGGVALLAGLVAVDSASAAVGGACVNCHTMHNSQNGAPMTYTGADSISSGATDPSVGAQKRLTRATCVGCHTNATGSDTIVDMGDGTKIPIVYNVQGGVDADHRGQSNSVLAGGNFYWVSRANGDNLGHNVYGIAGFDQSVLIAPGTYITTANQRASVQDSDPNNDAQCYHCHGTLATAASGCEGCHYPRHHATGNGTPNVVDSEDGWYRFLGSVMGYKVMNLGTANGVQGIEHSKWEQDATSGSHNVYQGTKSNYSSGLNISEKSMGQYCSGCHPNFHSQIYSGGSNPGGTGQGNNGAWSGGAWIRHPSDVVLPNRADYNGYTTYNPLAPVAKTNLGTASTSTVTPGQDVVMCLSCHRPHGSPYGDMLRWDYLNNCVAGQGNADNCGCYACHTTKDGN